MILDQYGHPVRPYLGADLVAIDASSSAAASSSEEASSSTSSCTHGLSFDPEAAEALLAAKPADPTPLGFIMGSPAHVEARMEEASSRWPRLDGRCPLGCGYTGIAYASYHHYIAGDW